MKGLICAVVFGLMFSFALSQKKLDLLYQWRTVDFEFKPGTREQLLKSNKFIPVNAIPLDVDTWQKDGDDRIFVTFPKFLPGIPATLTTISSKKKDGAHLFKPYPDWSWHQEGNCDGITSVLRIEIDKCGRLWVLDTGTIEISTVKNRICQPQVLQFNLKTNKLERKHQFPNHLLKENSILATPAVDVRDVDGRCEDTFVYVADVTGFGLLVYDVKHDSSWRVTHNAMYPYPPWGTFKTNGVEFDLMDGIIGMALSPIVNGERKLYWHSFASVRESWVLASVLRNSTSFATPGVNLKAREFKMSPEERSSQVAPEVFDSEGNLYFNMIAGNTLNCWNQKTQFDRKNFGQILKDDVNLQFITGIKIVKNGKTRQDELWILTDRFQNAMVGKMDPKELNHRILKASLKDLLPGGVCEGRSGERTTKIPHRPTNIPHRHTTMRPRPGGYGRGGR